MLFHTKNEAGLQDRLTTVEMINNKNTSSTKKIMHFVNCINVLHRIIIRKKATCNKIMFNTNLH